MIELRWKKLDPGERKYYHGMPDNSVHLEGSYAVLQYLEGAMPVRVEGNVVTATAPSEWKDVELEE